MNRNEIIPGLWMGGEVLPLMAEGFDAIVSCREIEDFELLPTVKAFLWVPFKDEACLPEDGIVWAACQLVKTATDRSWKTLVHCTAGHNRSGLVVGSFLIQMMGMIPQEAMDLIREKRPGALTNQTFVDHLLSLVV